MPYVSLPLPYDFESDDSESDISSRKPYRATRYGMSLIYLGPLSTALSEGADMGMSLYIAKAPLPIVIPTCAISFASSMGLNSSPARESVDELHVLFTKKHSLSTIEWPRLSRKKETIAIMIGSLPIVWGLLTDGAKAYYFIHAIPFEYPMTRVIPKAAWVALGGTAAAGAIFTSFLTESTETYKTIRKFLAGEKKIYSSTTSKYISYTFGGGLSLLESIQDIVKSYVAVRSVLQMRHSILLGSLSLLNGATNFCFSGLLTMHAIDDFLSYLSQKKYEPEKLFAFCLATTLSSFLAFYSRSLNYEFYQESADDFRFNQHSITDPAFYALSWIMFVQEALLGTITLYPLMKYLTQRINQRLHHIFQQIQDYTNTPSTRDRKEKSKLLQEEAQKSQKTNPARFFSSTDKTASAKKSAQEKRWQCGIV